jgi:transcriptional regulator with XRE-family HTH domain
MSGGEHDIALPLQSYADRLKRTVVIVLKGSRTDLDLSQWELADRLGWTRNTIANIESGRRAVHLLDFVMIARALKIEPTALLDRILRW